MKASIIGLGLMGGSMGLALKKSGMFKSISGFDVDELHLQQALSLGLIDEAITLGESKESDVIFLAMPVDGIIGYLKESKNFLPHTLIIDLGSTKYEIVKNIPIDTRKNFVASHPMCGTEHSGPKAAIEDLYKDKIVVLADVEDSGEAQVALAKEIFISIGMKIVKMDSKEHDRHAAFISHLPHIISYSLANTVLKQEDPKSILTLAAGGFKDMSRIAKSSPNMWSEICKQNKSFILESLEGFSTELEIVINFIQNEEWGKLKEWMGRANKLHEIL